MSEKIFEKLRDSKCERDSKGNHFWEALGVGSGSDAYLIWRCSQCKKCIIESLDFLGLGEDDFRMSKKDEEQNRVINHFFKKAESIKGLKGVSRKRLHTILFQCYYLGFEAGKEGSQISPQASEVGK